MPPVAAMGLPGPKEKSSASCHWAIAASHALFAAIYLGLVPSLVAYGTWAMVLARFPAARASNFMYCVPPVATLLGFLWLGEVPSLLGIIGGALALGGVVLVNLKR